MNIEDKTEPVDKSVVPERKVLHIYRGPKKMPEPGDKGLCGYVKKSPMKYHNWEEANAAIARGEIDPCIVCFEMSGRLNV